MSRYAPATAVKLQALWDKTHPDQTGWEVVKRYHVYVSAKGRESHGRKRWLAKHGDRSIVLGNNFTTAKMVIAWLKGRNLNLVTRTPADPLL